MHDTTSSNHNESEGKSDEEDFVEAYQLLLKESKKMAKHNKELRKWLFELENENKSMTSSTKVLKEE